MNVDDWVQPADLSNPITALGVLLVGRDGVARTKAVGSGVFVAPGLIMTVKHVLKEFWRLFENPNVGEFEEQRLTTPAFELFAVQCPGNDSATALMGSQQDHALPIFRSGCY